MVFSKGRVADINGKVEFADPLTNRKSVVLHRDIQMKSADIFVITYFFLNNEE